MNIHNNIQNVLGLYIFAQLNLFIPEMDKQYHFRQWLYCH